MTRARPALALASAAALLSGCVAAALPVAASAAIGRKLAKRDKQPTPEADAQAEPGAPRIERLPLTALPPPDGSRPATPADRAAVPSGMQYLYGSGEAAAISLQAYRAVRNHLSAEARLKALDIEPDSVVLARGSTLDKPRFEPCGTKPLAMVMDADETVLLNLGYEADQAARGGAYDEARWQAWERTGAAMVRPVPGAVAAVDAARKAGVTVVFNTNRSEANAAGTVEALRSAGLGDAVPGETLWLRGTGVDGGKDERRWRIAERYCVVALVGDQLGDFTDLLNAVPFADDPAARRAAANADPIASLWGAGWFVLPNPAYGTALKGRADQIFPPDTHWAPPTDGVN